ncbi:hypothetical protein [Rhodococcus sp. NPDC059234]|uniref:hypothetical protein n=1 Tax=Rhodococcus sp. NPDC059234 TaxID=3346781 RepID=UPI00366C45D4
MWTARPLALLRSGRFRRCTLLAVTYQGAVDAMLDHLETHPDVEPTRDAATLAGVLLGGICCTS